MNNEINPDRNKIYAIQTHFDLFPLHSRNHSHERFDILLYNFQLSQQFPFRKIDKESFILIKAGMVG